METIDLLNMSVKKEFPQIYNILKQTNEEGKFEDLKINLKPLAREFFLF